MIFGRVSCFKSSFHINNQIVTFAWMSQESSLSLHFMQRIACDDTNHLMERIELVLIINNYLQLCS